jgi:hypothetical protein
VGASSVFAADVHEASAATPATIASTGKASAVRAVRMERRFVGFSSTIEAPPLWHARSFGPSPSIFS